MKQQGMYRAVTALSVVLSTATVFAQTPLPKLREVSITSTIDQTPQPTVYWAPASAATESTPLFVFLHSWSGNYKQNNSKWLAHAVNREWIFLHPDFRGVNNSPQACGSAFARQDILDAMDWAAQKFNVDRQRVYLAGSSGGGHMTMLMAGHHPERFSAASAWVGISDLAAWHDFHTKNGKPQRYAQMILASLAGAPGTSRAIDAEYKDRSPLFHIHNVGELPLEIAAGVHDGKTGSVPISHSLNAFNAIARAHGSPQISAEDIERLWADGQLPQPQPEDTQDDPAWSRRILLRRTSGNARVTVFEGGHESLPDAAVDWLASNRRMAKFSEPADRIR